MVAASVVTYSQEVPTERNAARHLAGPLVPTLVKLWTDTYSSIPETYFLLVHGEDSYEPGQTGPVRRLNPAAFAKTGGSVPVVCTMTDDPEAVHSKYCIWKLGHGDRPETSA